MDYDGIIHCFKFDPENNEYDKLLLENFKLYEEQFKVIFQNIGFDDSYDSYDGNVLEFQ